MLNFDFFLSQKGLNIYLILFLSLLAGAFGLPIPEDIPLIAAGVLIHEKETMLLPTFIICYIGIILGDVIIYSVGRFFGPSLYRKKWFQRKISKHSLKKVRSKLEKRSLLTIFIARHLFWIRTATFLLCGIVRIRPLKFILADAIAAFISVPVMISLGFYFFANLEDILANVPHAENTIFISLLVIISLYMTYRVIRKKRTFKDSINNQIE